MSGRMGILWTLASLKDAAAVEYGCMGHMMYGRVFLNRAGLSEGARLYSTHIDETDISMGDTKRLDRVICEIISNDRPKAVFLLPSSVPMVIGTDLAALSRELQPEYPDVPIIPFGRGSFDVHGCDGVRDALTTLAETLPEDTGIDPDPKFNIIGSCADMFRFGADARETVRIMRGAFGLNPLCIMTSDASVDDIRKMGGARVNLVMRREGEKAAACLNKRFGTPCVSGRPYGVEGTLEWIEAVAEALGISPDQEFIRSEKTECLRRLAYAAPMVRHILRSHPDEAAVSLGGHADVVKGILGYAVGEVGLKKGACWCDCPGMASEDIPYLSENEWTEAVRPYGNGLLMANAEVLMHFGCNQNLQISNPDTRWRVNPYEPPFVGFRGALNLADLWFNAMLEKN
jgi:nitrogenase molybdenum-iron protein alpha/beta subunit